jgi:hypothetical protein
VTSGQRAEDKERPLRLSQKSRRSRNLKSEQADLLEREETTDLSGVAELFNSPMEANSVWKRESAVLSAGRRLSSNSADLFTPNVSELKSGVSSGKKTPKCTVRQSLFERLTKKSIQCKSALDNESVGNEGTPESFTNILNVGRKSRSMSFGSLVASDETNQTSSRKSRSLSVKWSPNSESLSTMRKISSSAEFERAATPVTVSNQTASRRSSRIAMNSPQSVKSNSGSLAKSSGKGTPPSKLSCSPTPRSQNTTFDFDSVRTPRISVDYLVSPLSSSRKRKSLRWQNVITSFQKRNSEPSVKRRHISERIDGNITFSGDRAVHLLSPQPLLTSSLIDEPIHMSSSEGEGWESCDNGFSDRVKACFSPRNATQNKKMSPTVNLSGRNRIHRFSAGPGISESFENDLKNISGVIQLMKTPGSPKSPVNDMPDVTVPRTRKSSKDGLTDVRVVKQFARGPRNPKLTKTQRSPKSPKNGIEDVRSVGYDAKTLRSPKSPQNDLRDVRGVRNLMKTPRSPKSPKNDLTDVRGIKRLMTLKSPLNDLSDVRGVKRLMTSPKQVTSPLNDLSDVRGVKKLRTSAKQVTSPLNDLSDVRGVKKLMASPKQVMSPLNDLSDVRGVKRLMASPKQVTSPLNDLLDVRGVKRLMTWKSPLNDLSDVHGVKRLMASPRVRKSRKNDIANVSGIKELLETPSARSASYSLTDDVDHRLEKTPPLLSVNGKVPSLVTRARYKQTSVKTTPVKNSTKMIKKDVPETAGMDTEVSVDQRNVALPEEVKVKLL